MIVGIVLAVAAILVSLLVLRNRDRKCDANR